MNVQTQLTSDVIGLTKIAPFSRRGFMTASAAVAAGYTLAAGPVRADVITTPADGLDAGDIKIKVADGEMPGYFARPKGVANPPVVLVAMEIFGLHEYIKDVTRRLAKLGALAVAPDTIISGPASISPRSPTFRSSCRSSTPSRMPSCFPISTARSHGPNRQAVTPTGSALSASAAADALFGNMPLIRAHSRPAFPSTGRRSTRRTRCGRRARRSSLLK